MCGTLRERTHKYQLKDVSSSDHLVFVFVPVFVYLYLCICICVFVFVHLYLCFHPLSRLIGAMNHSCSNRYEPRDVWNNFCLINVETRGDRGH